MDTPFGVGPSSGTTGVLSLSIDHSNPRWSITRQLQLFPQSPARRTAAQVDQACGLQLGLGERSRQGQMIPKSEVVINTKNTTFWHNQKNKPQRRGDAERKCLERRSTQSRQMLDLTTRKLS